MRNYIGYYRVSTQRQGRSGLGLEAQREMVQRYVASVGGHIIAEFTEIESGRAKNRPELRKALALARNRRNRATLIVAKLDRLARNVAFVSALLDTPGVEFKAADLPEANRMMVQMLAVVAEYEAKQISERTKAALEARRRRGLPLGNPATLLIGGSPAAEHNREKARQEAERLGPVLRDIKAAGIVTIRGIAQELNRRGYTTPRGTPFHPTTVNRVLGRLAA